MENKEKEISIEIKNLTIKYKGFKSYSIKKNLFNFNINKAEEFEAVKDVSFTVKKGSIVGLIGRNGSGKSTLLKAIAGIFSPDCGSIDLKGNSVSLLSIGVGFQKELSGRENIMLSGMLLGFPEDEIKAKTEEIIKFAELGKFIDMPVRTYSSGMHSKLSFSITAILETDIILVDEVLSVGDEKFKKKSYERMKKLILDENRTVIIVSHNVNTLKELCTEVKWMNDGMIKMEGKPSKVLDAYLTDME